MSYFEISNDDTHALVKRFILIFNIVIPILLVIMLIIVTIAKVEAI